MYKITITFTDGTVIVREVFGRIQAYTLYYNAKRNSDVRDVQMKGVGI